MKERYKEITKILKPIEKVTDIPVENLISYNDNQFARLPDLELEDGGLEAKNFFSTFVLNEIKKLSSGRLRFVLSHYYGVNNHKALTCEEIGHELNLCRERISQLKIIALRQLKRLVKKALKKEGLLYYKKVKKEKGVKKLEVIELVGEIPDQFGIK